MVVGKEAFCRAQLPRVSRTFALTIPLLPEPLDLAMTVAYLLCRIADTLEDEAPGALQGELLDELAGLVELRPGWEARARSFVRRAGPSLRDAAPEAEAELLAETSTVLETLASLPSWVHPHVARCVRIMTDGMYRTQRAYGRDGRIGGLPDLEATFLYCYYVAGVVGEMLTGLFTAWSPRVASLQPVLIPRGPIYGRALQLTNILKDVGVDWARGCCWLPLDRMVAHGLGPSTLTLPSHHARVRALMAELVAVTRRQLDAALEYSLALPVEETGLRSFCLYALFLSVLTLNAVEDHPSVSGTMPVKISREAVRTMIGLIQEQVSSNEALRALHADCSRAPQGMALDPLS